MCQGRHVIQLFDVLGDIQRVLAGTAAGTVGHAHKGGAELGDLLRGEFYAVKTGFRLGGEYLKG